MAACQEAAVLTRVQEAEAARRDATQQPAGCRGGGGHGQQSLHWHHLCNWRKREFPSKSTVNHAYSKGKARGHGGSGKIFVEEREKKMGN